MNQQQDENILNELTESLGLIKAKRPDSDVGALKCSSGSERVAHADLDDGVELEVLGILSNRLSFSVQIICEGRV